LNKKILVITLTSLVNKSFCFLCAKSSNGFYPSCLSIHNLAHYLVQNIYEWSDTFTDINRELPFLVVPRLRTRHLRTDWSVGLRSRWRNSWQIIIDRVATSNLRKHHESPRRASVITARNCKSISHGHPFAPTWPSAVLYPLEVQRRSFAIAYTKRLAFPH